MSKFNNWRIKGDDYYDREEYDKSIKAYNHALEFDKFNVEIWNNLGYTYSNKALKMEINNDDQYNEVLRLLEIAIEKHQKALQCDPNNSEALHNIGLNYKFMGEDEKSINPFKKALKLNPENFEIWINLALAYSTVRNYHKGIYALKKAKQINPRDNSVWRHLGRFYLYDKNYNEAEESLRESLKLNSHNGYTWSLLGHVYREMEKNQESIKSYKKAIEIEPNNPVYRKYLGLSYNKAKDYKNAILIFKNALDEKPEDGLLWNYLGVSYNIGRDYNNAIKAFEQSLKYNYKNLIVWNNLVKIYLKLKKYEKVIELCENIFKIKWGARNIIYKQQIPNTYDFLSVAYKYTGKNIESQQAASHAKELSKNINIKDELTEENLKATNWKTVLNYSNKYYNERIYEKQIEDTIVKNPEILEDGLKLIGRQYKTSVGFIDILFKDQEGSSVVVELKRGKGSDKVVGQIQRYMAWVNENLIQAKSVRGIIVVKENDKKLNYAIKGSKFPIEVVTFKNEPPTKNNIKYCDKCGAVNRKSAKFCEKCQNKFWMK